VPRPRFSPVLPIAALLAAALAWSGARAQMPLVPAPAAPAITPRAPGARPGDRAAGFLLVIDPGHGGRDEGSKGPGVAEKEVTLKAAKLLGERLKRHEGITVLFTREDDTELTPVQRAAIANFNLASFFLSLQADASWRPGARGASILLSAPQRPPRVEGEPFEAVALRWQRGQNVHLAGSLRFAQELQTRFAAIPGAGKPPILTLPLQGLEGARMPAAYVSLGVISTPEEAARLRELDAENPYIVALEAEILRLAGLQPAAPGGQDAPPGPGQPSGRPDGPARQDKD